MTTLGKAIKETTDETAHGIGMFFILLPKFLMAIGPPFLVAFVPTILYGPSLETLPLQFIWFFTVNILFIFWWVGIIVKVIFPPAIPEEKNPYVQSEVKRE